MDIPIIPPFNVREATLSDSLLEINQMDMVNRDEDSLDDRGS